MMTRKHCLATVTDDEFCTGTEVLLHSFLKYNGWFDGDIVLLINELSEHSRERLRRIFPVIFLSCDSRLLGWLRVLMTRVPGLSDIVNRFLSLETFRLHGYEKAVFVDSDICCTGDIRELFERPESLLASPDGYTYEQSLDPHLLAAGLPPVTNPNRYGHSFQSSFSAGVMAIGQEHLTEAAYLGLLSSLEHYDPGPKLVFTDQAVLNAYFKDRFTPLSGKYNYRIILEDYIRYADGISFSDARLLHFAGPIKPWNEYRQEDILRFGSNYLRFIDVWRQFYEELRQRNDPQFIARRIMEQRAVVHRASFERDIRPIGRLD